MHVHLNETRYFSYFFIIVWVLLVLGACGSESDEDDNSSTDTNGTIDTLSPPSDLKAAVIGADSIRLTWTDNSDNEDGFEIQQADDGVNFDTSYDVGSDAASYTVEGLGTDLEYAFRVRHNGCQLIK